MFNCRLLCRSISLVETTYYCKCTNAQKSNVLKVFNTENKYLFGGLIENQKQRRKKQNKDLLLALENKETIEQKNNSSTPKSKEKSKSSKNKAAKTIVNAKNTEEILVSESKNNNGSHLVEIVPVNEKLATTKKSSKSNAKSYKSTFNSLKLATKVDKFAFQPLVPINEQNYPLNNPNKMDPISSECNRDNILCLGFSDSTVKDYLKYPSVSKIMEDTMSAKSRFILKRWRQNMVEDLGEEGFSKHLAGLKLRGQEFHQAVRGTVLGEPLDNVGEVAQNALKSLGWLLNYISNPMAVESITAHPALEYKGIPDCVAMFKDIPVLIDWKLSDKPKKDLKDTYEAPVQISAYIGAFNHDPNYKWTINHGLVAVAYASGDPCDVFLLAPKHCQVYWRHWLLRYDKFRARSHLHLDHDIDEKELELI